MRWFGAADNAPRMRLRRWSGRLIRYDSHGCGEKGGCRGGAEGDGRKESTYRGERVKVQHSLASARRRRRSRVTVQGCAAVERCRCRAEVVLMRCCVAAGPSEARACCSLSGARSAVEPAVQPMHLVHSTSACTASRLLFLRPPILKSVALSPTRGASRKTGLI